ncbi:4'-phosphopantetheinyl transferase family protein [Erwinia oleae]|uniref:4'-phosphopantetheinyl transferase family protein n=1 Tax=Erwinia oleae TaxID=796334 RepID=UPI000689E322|nr:4'-phosphopantetheinyl transferase superfamily protein [Erwinia oleae]
MDQLSLSLYHANGPITLAPPLTSRHFLSALHCHPLPEKPAVLLFQARYHPARYHQNLHDLTGIPLPAPLEAAVNKRRAEYLASRALVRHALEVFHLSDFLLVNDADRAPCWPEGIAGSLSHTDGYVCLLLARAQNDLLVGVDVEQIMRDETAHEMADMIINAQEKALLQQSGLPFASALTAAFSLKESLYKALFPGLRRFIDFHQAEIVAAEPQLARVTLQLPQALSALLPAGRCFNGHVIISGSELLSRIVTS